MDIGYFIEKSSESLNRLRRGKGSAKEKLRLEAHRIFLISYIPDIKDLEEVNTKLQEIKKLITTHEKVVVNGVQEKSGFDASIDEMDEKTASKIINDLIAINAKVKLYRDLKRKG